MTDIEAWDATTRSVLEGAYLAAGDGPRGAGSRHSSTGDWRAKRQHLAVPMDRDGTWLDVGCANGFLMVTLPAWCAERGVRVEPYGLELSAPVADLARSLRPGLTSRIWTGSVMSWTPPQRFTYVTALDDQVPPARLGELVDRLLDVFVAPGGRVLVSSYGPTDDGGVDLFDRFAAHGLQPDGRIHIERPARHPLLTGWFDARATRNRGSPTRRGTL